MRRAELAALAIPLLPELARFAGSLARPAASADEIVNEAIARALNAAGTLEDPRRLRAWLFRIVRNAHIDLLRARAARDRLVVLAGGIDELDEIAAPMLETAPAWDRADLESALARLPEHARSALLLSDLWGFSQDEIAEALDIPAGTVKSRVARARACVASLLADTDSAQRRTKGDAS